MSDKKTCFVVMGFGKKTDFQTGRVLDLDKSYFNIIKPAAEAAGLDCKRADEILHSGTIDTPMYEQLLMADVVVADVSTSNSNAFYELGVRHALRPFTTITIAEDKMILPFDVNHVTVRRYKHMGDGIDYDEVMSMRKTLTEAIQTIAAKPSDDSPVYTFVKGLKPPFREMENALLRSMTAPPDSGSNETVSSLMKAAQELIDKSEFATACELLRKVKEFAPRDAYVTQKLALATYKCALPSPKQALDDAKSILQELATDDTTDTETLGLWGAIHKRLWDLTGDSAALDISLSAYEKAFVLKRDHWTGINLAFLYSLRASNAKDPADAEADRVIGRRIRQRVLDICQPMYQANSIAEATNRYWLLATMSEAWLGLGDEAKSRQFLEEASALHPAKWMLDSTAQQRARLEKLL